ncbi:MAG TPA: PTS sugar transporter subunit IIA [Opitutaceae bacterium]|nr:PTS sugar transporter subunit IIA [Opitutaceae bacterium]
MRSILTALQEGRLFELPESGKTRALEFLARILDANPDIEVGTDALDEIQKREFECNTGIGMGVAVPHIRARREEGDLFCAVGWSPTGVDYGAPDSKPVHLVVMYYIPGAQKNVYLKEVSTLVKAMKKTGGIDPIAHAPDLNTVRNLLLDWVSSGLGESGPEAVARMIKLDVRQTQAAPALAPAVAPAPAPAVSVPAVGKAVAFQVLVASPTGVFVLAGDADWSATMEKDAAFAQRLASGGPFVAGGRNVFVTSSTQYPAGRVLYQGIAIAPAA